MPPKTGAERAKTTFSSIVDPRLGDVEDDASSPKQRSLLALAGSLLVEISLAKLVVAWALLLVLPGLLIGLAPMLVSSWLIVLTNKIASLVIGLWSVLLLAAVLALGWFGWRPLLRWVELSFWSLNSIVVEPAYTACREALRHLAERLFARHATDDRRARLRARTAAAAGILICAVSALVFLWAWPRAHLFGDISELSSWGRVALVALANSVVMITGYLGVAALIWGIADAAMEQPRTLKTFQSPPREGRRWRIVHLSDVHVVGERYGFRLESGRSGPRGNERFKRLLKQLDAIHAREPLDQILITRRHDRCRHLLRMGRVPRRPWKPSSARQACSDAARQSRSQHRRSRQPGAHGPAHEPEPAFARAQDFVRHGRHGKRVRVVSRSRRSLGKTLAEVIAPHADEIARFADAARPYFSTALAELWAKVFPLVVPPERPDGLGIVLFNSNADTHFSFRSA